MQQSRPRPTSTPSLSALSRKSDNGTTKKKPRQPDAYASITMAHVHTLPSLTSFFKKKKQDYKEQKSARRVSIVQCDSSASSSVTTLPLPGTISIGVDEDDDGYTITNRQVSAGSDTSTASTDSSASSVSSAWSQYWEYKQPRNYKGQVVVPYPNYCADVGQPTISYEQFLARNPPPKRPQPARAFKKFNPYPQVPGYPGYGYVSEEENDDIEEDDDSNGVIFEENSFFEEGDDSQDMYDGVPSHDETVEI